MEKHVKLPEFYFSFIVFCLRIVGIDVLNKEESLLYRLYSAWAVFLVSGYILFQCVEFKFHSDFDSISFIIWYVMCQSLTMLKVAVIYKNRKQVGGIMRSFHEGYYKPNRNRGGGFEEHCISKILRKIRFQTNFYGFVLLSCWLSGVFSSIKSRLTQPSESWTLPFLPITFVDTRCSPNFEFMYVYQGVTTYYVCFWIYICDSAVISIIAQSVAQLKILERYVRKYKHRNMRFESEKGMSSDDILQDTIGYHLSILKTIDKIESVCSYLVLCVFATALVCLCLDMYFTSTTNILSIEFVRHVVYSLHIGVQIFMYCWWGNEMTLANEDLAAAVSGAYDPYEPVVYSKSLQMMLVKAQKPLLFTAGKFVPLSVDTLKGIMKGSFSYFAVLRQVNSEQVS